MLQNRVNPWGGLCAVSNRGQLMGNRGILHNDKREIVAPWRHKHWVTCLLAYKGIQRPKPFSTTDHYSELFFLDEATAFAAGHRPCNYCQRERLATFKSAWVAANMPGTDAKVVRMNDIDNTLHRERTDRSGIKKTYDSVIGALPRGTFFEKDGEAYIVGELACYPWTFGGYGDSVTFPPELHVKVLTPASIVNAFRAGFVPVANTPPSCSAPTIRDIDELLALGTLLVGNDAKPLYAQCPRDATEVGVIYLTEPSYSHEIEHFFRAAAKSPWVDTNYLAKEIHNRLRERKFVANATLDDIRSILTHCVRGERFCSGHWASVVETGVLQAVLIRLEEIRREQYGKP